MAKITTLFIDKVGVLMDGDPHVRANANVGAAVRALAVMDGLRV